MLFFAKKNISNEEDMKLHLKKIVHLEKKLMKKTVKMQRVKREYEGYAYTYLLLMRGHNVKELGNETVPVS